MKPAGGVSAKSGWRLATASGDQPGRPTILCRTSSPTKREARLYTKAPNRWKTVNFLLLAAIGTGCSTAPKLPELVLVPTPVACLSAPPPEVPPLRSEAEILAMDDYAATLVTYAERLELRAWAEKAEALLLACR